VLTATFVRTRGRRDHVYVVRGDATTVDWAFPSYGDGLPHDLCHLVVEDGLGLHGDFWGLIDGHVDVQLIDNEATLVRRGRPLVEEHGIDLSGLRRAEAAVAAMAGPGVDLDAAAGVAPDDVVTAITDRLRELCHQWRALDNGGAITVVFPAPGTPPPSR